MIEVAFMVFRANEDRENIIDNIAQFVTKQNKTSGHKKYAIYFMFCQVRNIEIYFPFN